MTPGILRPHNKISLRIKATKPPLYSPWRTTYLFCLRKFFNPCSSLSSAKMKTQMKWRTTINARFKNKNRVRTWGDNEEIKWSTTQSRKEGTRQLPLWRSDSQESFQKNHYPWYLIRKGRRWDGYTGDPKREGGKRNSQVCVNQEK